MAMGILSLSNAYALKASIWQALIVVTPTNTLILKKVHYSGDVLVH